jgi:hypothetical protein
MDVNEHERLSNITQRPKGSRPCPPGNIAFEIPAREIYCPVTISGLIVITAHILLMFIIRTVRLLEISCCLSHLVCQLTLINNLFLVLINYFTIKI